MLKQFFWVCSGADLDILSHSPKSEQERYAGIGATVFFTALMAFLSGSYALFTVFDNLWIAIGFGLVWGLLIFNLDRYIVSTLRKGQSFSRELLQASPRIALAIIIAVVISTPLELKIFEKEINRELLSERNRLTELNREEIKTVYSSELARLESENRSMSNTLNQKKGEVDALYDKYISEAEGTDGTMKLGKGPVYNEKREKHDKNLAEYDSLNAAYSNLIQENNSEIAELYARVEKEAEATQPIIDNFDGFLARINALNRLPKLPQIFIFLLFVAIETAPILSKLISGRGPYDLILEDKESAIAESIQSKILHRNHIAESESVLNERVYSGLQSDDEIFLYRKQKARVYFNARTDRFFDEQGLTD